MIFIPKDREKEIRNLTDLLKEEYKGINAEAIKNIAKKYGDVKTITKTPLVGERSCALPDKNGNYHIFHWESLPFCERFNLAHETGHMLLHDDIKDNTNRLSIKDALKYELEADLFASRLCNIPLPLIYLYQYSAHATASWGTNLRNILRYGAEAERLKKKGVYDILEYNGLASQSENNFERIRKLLFNISFLTAAAWAGFVIGEKIEPNFGKYIGEATGLAAFLRYRKRL